MENKKAEVNDIEKPANVILAFSEEDQELMDESARHNNELEQADAYSRISFAFSAVMPHISAMDS